MGNLAKLNNAWARGSRAAPLTNSFPKIFSNRSIVGCTFLSLPGCDDWLFEGDPNCTINRYIARSVSATQSQRRGSASVGIAATLTRVSPEGIVSCWAIDVARA